MARPTTSPAVTFIVPPLLPEGFALLVGAPKAGKSWFSQDTALGVAAGTEVLGEPVQQRPVLHLALEDSDRRVQHRARHLRPGTDLPRDYHYLVRIPATFSVGDTIEAWLERLPSTSPPPLVIVDTLGKVRAKAGRARARTTTTTGSGTRMKALADALPGASLVAVHHDRKAGSTDFVDTVSGTNGLAGSADTILVLRRERDAAEGLLLVTGRDVTEAAYAATFDAGIWRRVGGSWQEARAAAAAVAASAGLGDTAHRIVALITQQGPLSPKQVAEMLDVEPDTVRKQLSRLALTSRLDRAAGIYFLPGGPP